jgi:hypothetical protein
LRIGRSTSFWKLSSEEDELTEPIAPPRNSLKTHLVGSFFFKIKEIKGDVLLFTKIKTIRFHTRKWIKPEDLNPNGTLFGGQC